MRRRTGLVIITGALILMAASGRAESGTSGKTSAAVESPGGLVRAIVSVESGRLEYAVEYGGREVVLSSALGFRFASRPPIGDGLSITGTETGTLDETWKPVWGQVAEIRNACNEMTVTLTETGADGRTLSVVFRAYDDGVGFRYVLPKQPGLGSFRIVSEETEFRLAGDHTVWWIPNDHDSYEHLYRETPLSDVTGANTPATMATADGLFLSIHEAALKDYAGMTLVPIEGTPNALTADLVPWPDGTKVLGTTPLETPWRTIQIGRRPGDLVESHLILNLNEPCAIEDTSWIRPMKYVGIWWGMHIGKYSWHEGENHGATTENARRHIDFAAEHGFDAVLMEGWNTGWDRWGARGAFDYVTPYGDFDLAEVVRYGSERGVSIIGHHETGGDAEDYERRVDEAFDLYTSLGVPAVKTGYAGGIYPRGQRHHGQWMVYHYRQVLEKAAAKRLMLDVHEPIKPTGISRTYPNMMTREGVRGMEYNAWSEGNPPEHTTVLPFTRMLAGPLDYTPGIFDLTLDDYKPENRVHTTLAKQLALFVVLWSPVQMAADLPENYEGDAAFEFIERVPCDWDDTRVVDAVIGDHVTVARRSGDTWFLGGITDETGRTLTVPLDFLEDGVTYRTRAFRDAADADWRSNPRAIEIVDLTVSADDRLELELAPGGGQAIIFFPAAPGEEARNR